MEIIQNSQKIEEKFPAVPKKTGSGGFPETRHFFFFVWPQCLHCLPFCLHLSNALFYDKTTLLG